MMDILISCVLFVSVPAIGAWTVKLGLLLETDRSCQKPEQCQHNVLVQHQSDYMNISLFTIPSSNPFAKFKAINNFQGDILLTSNCASYGRGLLDAPEQTTSPGKCSSECCYNLLEYSFYVNSVNLPSINTDVNGNWETKNDRFLDLLAIVLKNEELTTYIVIMSSIEDRANVIPALPIEGTTVMSYVVDDYGHFSEEEQLKEIFENFDEENLNFIVICSTGCIKNIMNHLQTAEEEVRRSAYFKRSRWLLVPTNGLHQQEEEVLDSFPRIDSSDIAILSCHSCQKKYGRLAIMDITDEMAKLTAIDSPINAAEIMREIIKRLIANEPPAVGKVYGLFATNNGQKVRLIGKVASDRSMVLTRKLFHRDRYGYNNRTFVVGILPWEPFVYKHEINGTVDYSGIAVDILEELARRLNFSYIYKEPDSKEWGRVLNGEWTGLVGEVSERKIDLVGCPLSISNDRESVMDFTTGYYFDHAVIIFEKENPTTNRWLTLIAPFRYEVHVCIIVSLIFCTIFLFLLEEVNPGNKWSDNRLCARRSRYGDIFWYHFGAIMTNGGAYLPNTVSGRAVLACWWIFTVMTAAVYSGNLIAFLAVNRQSQPFNSLSEMIESDYKWGLLGGSAYITLIKNSNDSDYREIWRVIERESILDPDIQSINNDVHFEKVHSEKYAFIGETTTWNVWKRKSCDLDVLGEHFHPMVYAMGFPNNSVHTNVFSKQLQSIQESGLVEVWLQKWLPDARCDKSNEAKPADIIALQSLFYVAGAMVLLAVLILITESYCNMVTVQEDLSDNQC